MVEYRVNVKQLGKTFNLDVSYGDTYKASKNRSYPSASPYSETGKLVQKKFCSETGKEVSSDEITHSIYKVGKQEFRIPKDKLQEIRDNISSSANEISVKAVLKKGSEIPNFRIAGSKWLSPAKKGERDYIELKELCKDYTLVGEAVFKSNSFEVVLSTINDRLVLIKMASEDRMTNQPNLEGLQGIEISKEIVDMEKKILAKVATESYDFTEFVDKRQELEDELIEKIAIDGEDAVAAMPKKPIVDGPKADESELERLKKLLETEDGVEA